MSPSLFVRNRESPIIRDERKEGNSKMKTYPKCFATKLILLKALEALSDGIKSGIRTETQRKHVSVIIQLGM